MHPWDLREHYCHLQTLDRCNAKQNINLIQNISFCQLIQPDFQSISIKDQICLEELRAGIDFLVLAQGLELWIGGERRSCRAQEKFRSKFDLPPVKKPAFIAHSAQDPKHLDCVEVVDVHLLAPR